MGANTKGSYRGSADPKTGGGIAKVGAGKARAGGGRVRVGSGGDGRTGNGAWAAKGIVGAGK